MNWENHRTCWISRHVVPETCQFHIMRPASKCALASSYLYKPLHILLLLPSIQTSKQPRYYTVFRIFGYLFFSSKKRSNHNHGSSPFASKEWPGCLGSVRALLQTKICCTDSTWFIPFCPEKFASGSCIGSETRLLLFTCYWIRAASFQKDLSRYRNTTCQ
jgi:hypothetical protein